MRKIYLLLTLIIFFSCSTTKKSSEDEVDIGDCIEIFKNSYSNIKDEKSISVHDNDTIIVNEIKFECVESILYTSKILFDKYEKWDEVLAAPNEMHPTLMWKELDLFGNGKKYQVLTKGRFADKRYASIIVFDLDGNDLLTDNSKEKENIILLFANLIRSNQSEKREFFRHYWNAVDPNKWKL